MRPPGQYSSSSARRPLVRSFSPSSERLYPSSRTFLFSGLLYQYQFGHQTGPTCLVAGPQAGAIVAVKVFVKKYQVPPMRVILQYIYPAIDRPQTVSITQKQPDEAAGQICIICAQSSIVSPGFMTVTAVFVSPRTFSAQSSGSCLMMSKVL